MGYSDCPPMQMAIPLFAETREAAPPRAASEAILPGSDVEVVSASIPPSPALALATLLAEARLVQTELSRQPLPITNPGNDFILKLLGG